MRLKLHISPCPNDTFMFDALVNGRIDTGSLRFEVEYHDIEELNRGAGLGRADISKISCAVLPAIAEHYALLDSGAALGRGNGPLLVRRAGDTRPIRRVAVPGLHTTANALMGKLFPGSPALLFFQHRVFQGQVFEIGRQFQRRHLQNVHGLQ